MQVLLLVFLALGKWGEDPSKVPDFALPQERRCPKVPAGDQIFRRYGQALEVERLDHALLVCHIEALPKKSSSWQDLSRATLIGGPDLLVRMKLGAQPPMSLWGPEDHWKSYISFPKVTVAKGERIEVAVWDRDMFGKESFGQATVKWDGHLPLAMKGRRFQLECRAMPLADAMAALQPRLGGIDRALDSVAQAQVVLTAPNWGKPQGVINRLTGMFYDNFRYAAGFVGWDHPDIQSRLERLKTIEAEWQTRARTAVAAVLKTATDSAPGVRLDGKVCKGALCTVTVVLDADPPITCREHKQRLYLPQVIDEDGVFHTALATQDSCVATSEELLPSLRQPIALPRGVAHPRLLRLDAGPGQVTFLRLP
jgi:hypothetical protein